MDEPSNPQSTPDWIHWVRRGASDLGLTGAHPRAMACHPCPPAWIVSRVAGRLRPLFRSVGVRLEESVQAGGLAVLDPWRVELAMAGLALAALRHSDLDDGLGLAVRVRTDQAVFQVVSTSMRWADRLERSQDRAATHIDAVSMSAAMRVAEDHGGRLGVLIDRSAGAAVRIHLPRDPENPCRGAAGAPLRDLEHPRTKGCTPGAETGPRIAQGGGWQARRLL